MRKLLTPFLAAAALITLLAGCAALPLTGFTIELAKIERNADGSATATLRIVNPNVVAYNVESSTHTVFLDGKPAGTITVTHAEGVPAQTTVIETGTFTAAPGYTLSAGKASYRMETNLLLLLYGDEKEKQKLSGTGTVEISTK
ncbi:MAG TPA: hypothetical protein VFJ90_01945 [Candidatus Didemnitutus sp.]|nr:hypothetical protein [Candidatus Didemnitutus sp.]